MQQNMPYISLITPDAPISTPTHGGRAKCLQRLVRLDLPVPETVTLSFDAIKAVASGQLLDMAEIVSHFGPDDLLCVRPSSEDKDWGGPGAVLNIGMNDERYVQLSDTLGAEAAAALYLRFVQTYSVNVARLDADIFDHILDQGQQGLSEALRAYEDEADEAFPQDIAFQLGEVIRSMARAWEGTTARLLRQAKGAPADAGLGLVVQKMAFGLGRGECGSGVLQLVDSDTGLPQITGRYLRQSQGRDALEETSSLFLERDDRGPSLESEAPQIFATLIENAKLMRSKLREEMQIEFVVEDGSLHILDGIRVHRKSRAAVQIAVDLVHDGIIPKEEALLRVEPRAVTELLHRQVAADAPRDIIGNGIAASPGAATGKIVFSSEAALAASSRGEACILVRRETSPEDVRGMHAANAVLTERGGMTSHAAVIGRGLGLPCIVGATGMQFDNGQRKLIAEDGRVFKEGDIITVDGLIGQVLAGPVDMIEPGLGDTFREFLGWAVENADIRVRANADTPQDAQIARRFNAHGIGLCRTEHMFFNEDRLTVMQEMIFADTSADRRAVLDRLLPMQRADFLELFRIMNNQPVCIRLFDPPLHEFLPSDKSGLRGLAEALDLPMSRVMQRVDALEEYNPMLGLRGVRLGVTIPEIYEMQARAIFEATIEASKEGVDIVPEIMIPLVSAKREVELIKARVDAIAAKVRVEQSADFTYRLGVMVETPRAALRANEISQNSAFLSFGTNDLTQMTYGLSRDDAGRFMSNYVQQGVYSEDPFHTLDTEGVGELLQLGISRAREAKPDIVTSVCGEHGGNPESIAFCRAQGVDYVSCSPFRVPVAWLTAAQLAIRDKVG